MQGAQQTKPTTGWRMWGGAALLALAMLAGCGAEATTATAPCLDGATQPCSCDDGSKGSQTCASGGFGACSCASGQDAGGEVSVLDGANPGDAAEPTDGTAQTDAAELTDSAATTDTTAGTDAATGSDASTGPATCASDKDCKDAGKVCDPLIKQCVDCLTDAECGASQHCVGRVCQTYTACTNSLGCKSAKGPDGNDQPICDQNIGECSACLTAADCPDSHDCIAKACVPYVTCQNSTDCGKDEVCNKSTSRCVECLGSNDCSATQLCEQGQCRDFVPCSSDKQCTDKGLLCDPAKGKCAQCLDNSDCPDIYHCEKTGVDQTGQCVLDVCAQGQGACSNNAKVTCNAVGDAYGAPAACPAQTTCSAPGGKPECKPWLCQPGLSCDGNQAVECSTDGLQVLKTTDCAASAAKCVQGVCQPIVCEATKAFCDGQTKKVCSQDGLYVVESQPCGAGTFCDAGQCKPQVCTPASAVCNGNTATLCNEAGSGFASGGTPCGTELCVQGACKPLVCEPASKYCEGNVPKTCNADGTASSGAQACGAGTFCDAGVCKPQVCTPGAASCNGNAVQTCNAQGSGYTGTANDCGSNALCVAGKCEAKVCEPATVYCDGQVLKQCAASGLSATTKQTCGSTTFCGLKAGVAGCQPVVCTPGAMSCSGNAVQTCNALGSGFVGSATDCGSNALCVAGKCEPKICAPATVFCDGQLLKQCAASGLSATTKQTCGGTTYCGAGQTGDAGCQPIVCTPGADTCNGKVATKCNVDGSGYEPLIAVDCGASGKVCSAGACVSLLCDPQNPLYCEGNIAKKCDATGLAPTTLQTCGAGLYCAAGACSAQICAPNTLVCNGNAVQSCNAQGSGYTGAASDCGSGALCVAGKCEPKICEPATIYCDGQALKQCAASGLSATTKQTCGGTTFCGLGQTGDAGCQPIVCTPGADTCNGKVATKCKVDGSGYEPLIAVDCGASGKVCSAGACVNLLCDPQNPLYCEGNIAKKCDATGLAPTTLQTCGAGLYCAAGACNQQICTPGTATCAANKPATCNADGSGYVNVQADCGVGKLCDAASSACLNAFPSCAAWLAADVSATDGLYPIDPDGSGPIAAANLFCDMKNGGLTLVANIYDSAGDDAPNDTSYVVSGWQQTASGVWASSASTVDRAWGGTGSAAVSLAFVEALGAQAGQKNLKMCFVHQNGYDTVCRDSTDGSLTLVSYATGNPKLTKYAADKLTYTFGRLAGLAGSVDGYGAGTIDGSSCVYFTPGTSAEFGSEGKLCDSIGFIGSKQYASAWWTWGNAAGYLPWLVADEEVCGSGVVPSPSTTSFGFRLYIGPQPVCGNGIKETGEGCDDGGTEPGDGCSAGCQVEGQWTELYATTLDSGADGITTCMGCAGLGCPSWSNGAMFCPADWNVLCTPVAPVNYAWYATEFTIVSEGATFVVGGDDTVRVSKTGVLAPISGYPSCTGSFTTFTSFAGQWRIEVNQALSKATVYRNGALVFDGTCPAHTWLPKINVGVYGGSFKKANATVDNIKVYGKN